MESLVSRRYAEALFEIALESSDIGKIPREIRLVLAATEQSAELNSALVNESVTCAEKKSVMTALFQDRVSEEVMNFLRILADKNRCELLAPVAEYLDDIVNCHKNILTARVVSAVPLSPERAERLADKLEKATGQKILLELETAPDLIGGMVVNLGNKTLDASVKTELEKMRKQLSGAFYEKVGEA